MKKIDREQLKKLRTPALFTAAVWLLTLTGAFCRIGDGAYIHIGDAAIYTAALLLPLPQAVAVSAIGAGLADITLGSTVYLIPTVIIKALLVLAAKGLLKLSSKPVLQDLFVCLSGIVTVVGYYAAEVVLDMMGGGTLASSLSSAASDTVIYNILQALACAVVYTLISGILRPMINKRKTVQTEE